MRPTRERSRPTQTAHRTYDLLAEGFGPGFNGPIPIVVAVNGDHGAPQRVYDAVRGLKDVDSVVEAAVQQGEDGRNRVRHAGLGTAG